MNLNKFSLTYSFPQAIPDRCYSNGFMSVPDIKSLMFLDDCMKCIVPFLDFVFIC